MIFKFFKHWNINNLQAIIVNYVTCIGCGLILSPDFDFEQILKPWLPYALGTGLLFISVFIMMAKTAQEFGISVSAVASKLAVIFPVSFGIWIAGESLPFSTALGIALSMISVWLVAFSDKTEKKGRHFLMPLFVFLGSGIIDLSLKFISWQFKPQSESLLAVCIFFVAAITGILYYSFTFKNQEPVKVKNILSGLLLGIPNYFSIYFLLKAIAQPELPAVLAFPINNIGVVLLSTLLSILIFKEVISKKKALGIWIALLAIFLLNLNSFL